MKRPASVVQRSSQPYPGVFRCGRGQRWLYRATVPIGRFASRALRAHSRHPRTRKFLRNRHDVPANSCCLVLEFHCGKYVRSQRLLRIFDLDRDIKQRREALTHEELAQLTTHEDGDRDDLFGSDSSGSRAWNLETSAFWSLAVVPRCSILF